MDTDEHGTFVPLRRAVRPLLILAVAFAASSPEALRLSAQPAPPPVKIPFELVSRHIMIPVHVNTSQPLAFVLDTGARVGIISLDRAKELGLTLDREVQVGGAGPELTSGYLVKDATFRVAGLDGLSQPISMALPLGRLARRFGHDFDGILGADFIREFVIEVDYAARLLQFHDKRSFAYAGPGDSVPVRINAAGHPIVDAEVTPIGGSPIAAAFVIDLGSGGSLALHSPFVATHKLPGPDVKTIRSIGRGGTGGATAGKIGRVSALKVGRYTLDRPVTLFSEDRSGAFAGRAVQGNIGYELMSRFRIFLDYTRDRIILEPAASFGEPFARAASGIVFDADPPDYRTFRVTEVLEGSPASDAGVQAGDIVVSVDGRPAAELTLTIIQRLFEKPGSYKLGVRRGEQIVEVALTTRQMI